MTNGKHALRTAFTRIEREFPERVGRAIRWLRHPASRWIRIRAGLLLVLGGIFLSCRSLVFGCCRSV
jgi:hypothetical protein